MSKSDSTWASSPNDFLRTPWKNIRARSICGISIKTCASVDRVFIVRRCLSTPLISYSKKTIKFTRNTERRQSCLTFHASLDDLPARLQPPKNLCIPRRPSGHRTTLRCPEAQTKQRIGYDGRPGFFLCCPFAFLGLRCCPALQHLGA